MRAGRRYHIGEVIGTGSFGTVYRAQLRTDGGFSKEVAVKLLHPHLSGADQVARRLRDEARLLGLVRHRSILQVDGLVLLGERWAVVTELVDGVNLLEVLRRGAVPAAAAAEIASEIALALAVAYGARTPGGDPLRLIHRDIKPSNVQVTAAGEVKVLDFGIARAEFAERETETQSLILVGSPAYMSPERLEGIDGPEGDVYALGAVLYEALTGFRLGRTHPGRPQHDVLLEGAVGRLMADELRGTAGLADLVLRMLDFDPAKRPTAAEVAERCRDLAPELPPPALHAWASACIPALCAERTESRDDLSGKTLTESASPGPPGGSPIPWAGVAGLAGAAILIAVVAFGMAEPAGAPAPPAVTQLPPTPPMEVPPAPEARDSAAEAPPPEPAVLPAPVPAAPPTLVPVAVGGDADGVTLVRGDASFALPAEVPPGTYTIVGRFGPREVTMAVQLPVRAGGRPTVRCQRAFLRCTPL